MALARVCACGPFTVSPSLCSGAGGGSTDVSVVFRRVGVRRYSVVVLRKGLPPHEFGGPGYDDKMPHDLQHFIVERELGIEHGIFGFLSAGGETGGDPHEVGRAASRRRRKSKQRDERMKRRGARAEGAASEHAAGTCWFEWLRRSGDPRAATIATRMATTVSKMAEDARRQYGEEALARICACMDELSAKWSRLAIGESFTEVWRTASRQPCGAPTRCSPPTSVRLGRC
jgi:hypothetical protein